MLPVCPQPRGYRGESHPLRDHLAPLGPQASSTGATLGGPRAECVPSGRKPGCKTGIHLSRAGKSERRCASQSATPCTAAGELILPQQPWLPPRSELWRPRPSAALRDGARTPARPQGRAWRGACAGGLALA